MTTPIAKRITVRSLIRGVEGATGPTIDLWSHEDCVLGRAAKLEYPVKPSSAAFETVLIDSVWYELRPATTRAMKALVRKFEPLPWSSEPKDKQDILRFLYGCLPHPTQVNRLSMLQYLYTQCKPDEEINLLNVRHCLLAKTAQWVHKNDDISASFDDYTVYTGSLGITRQISGELASTLARTSENAQSPGQWSSAWVRVDKLIEVISSVASK